MTDKGRQLLLEILLLSERYSAKDVAWVAKQAVHFKEVGNLLGPLDSLIRSKQVGKGSEQKGYVTDDNSPHTLIEPFIAQLSRSRSTKDLHRLDAVAKRLGIDPNSAATNIILGEIKRRLIQMEPEELAKFLRGYKIPMGPDSSYVGLAEFLIGHKEEN